MLVSPQKPVEVFILKNKHTSERINCETFPENSGGVWSSLGQPGLESEDIM